MLDAIRKRRSIRKYTGDSVSEYSVNCLLKSAMQAPTARNLQPWEFVVIRNKAILRRIPDCHPHAGMVPDSEAAVLVCGSMHRQPDISYLLVDCAAAVENILLEAVNLDLGAVWLGIYPKEDRVAGIRKLLELPDEIIPVALVSIGVPGEFKEYEDRFDPGKVHLDRW